VRAGSVTAPVARITFQPSLASVQMQARHVSLPRDWFRLQVTTSRTHRSIADKSGATRVRRKRLSSSLSSA
jgi:hypothetical protein